MPARLLTQNDLRLLREALFKLELITLRKLVDNGIDPGNVALVADVARAIEAVSQLQFPARDR